MALRQRAGSFAAGTVAGTLTRRYHGLLVALQPPLGRHLMVAKVEEVGATYVLYQVLRGSGVVKLTLKCMVNCRDFHATTRDLSRAMSVAVVPDGLAVTAARRPRA